MSDLLSMRRLSVSIATKDALDVREFHVEERMSALFEITLTALAENADIDFEAVVGQPMSFSQRLGMLPHQTRTWTGVCNRISQVRVAEDGLSTYRLVLVPELWLSTQRRNHRMFQHLTEIEIVTQLLGEWGIQPSTRLSGVYKKRKYRVQYGE